MPFFRHYFSRTNRINRVNRIKSTKRNYYMCISLGIIPVVYVLRVEDKIIYFFLKLCVKRTKKKSVF